MSNVAQLAPFVALGLAGSLHCAGMCGGFAACASAAEHPRQRALAFTAYGLGKASTYAVLALAASLGVERLSHGLDASWVATLSRSLAFVAGGLIIATGITLTVPRFRLGRTGWLPRGLHRASCLVGSVRELPGLSGALGTGVVSGFLPCGLTLSMLVLAAQMAPAIAATGAAVFGLATLPTLALVALGGYWLPASLRQRVARLAGPALIVVGCITVVRGVPGKPLCHCERSSASAPAASPSAPSAVPSVAAFESAESRATNA